VRSLRIGRHRPRCLYTALVHYRLLCRRGQHPVVVIGLPPLTTTKDAHAWIELDGIDVGPPPGRGTHEAIMRLTAEATVAGAPGSRS